MTTRACAVYRHFDFAGTLLYVGVSVEPDKRTSAHMRRSIWHKLIDHITIEWHPSVASAIKAETRAIFHENPIYNVGVRHYDFGLQRGKGDVSPAHST